MHSEQDTVSGLPGRCEYLLSPVDISKHFTDHHHCRHCLGCCAGFTDDVEECFLEEISRFEHFD